MTRYLLIDYDPSPNPELQKKLNEPDSGMIQTTDADEIRVYLSSGMIKGVFIRHLFWDYRLFKNAIDRNIMPELVLLGGPESPLMGCCGSGMPEFLADDCSASAVESASKIMNCNFMQALDFKFVLAVTDGGKMFKLDISKIEKMVADADEGVAIVASCGEFYWKGKIEELEDMLKG